MHVPQDSMWQGILKTFWISGWTKQGPVLFGCFACTYSTVITPLSSAGGMGADVRSRKFRRAESPACCRGRRTRPVKRRQSSCDSRPAGLDCRLTCVLTAARGAWRSEGAAPSCPWLWREGTNYTWHGHTADGLLLRPSLWRGHGGNLFSSCFPSSSEITGAKE